MMALSSSVLKVVTEAGLGYGLGYMGLVANPMAAAAVAGSIAIVKEINHDPKFFVNAFRKIGIWASRFYFEESQDNETVFVREVKFSLETAVGAALVGLVWKKAFGVATMPVIQVIALSVLVKYGHPFLTATGLIIGLTILRTISWIKDKTETAGVYLHSKLSGGITKIKEFVSSKIASFKTSKT